MSSPAVAAITGTWTPNGSTSATASTVGVSVALNGTSSTPYVAGTLNPVNFWSDPYGAASVAGGPSISLDVPALTTTMTYFFNFSEPVDNPVLHVDRLGGIANSLSNSSQWTLSGWSTQSGGVTMQKLSGNTPLVVSPTVFRRTTNVAIAVTQPECENSTVGTGCGSIQFNGTGITSLTFSVVMVGSAGQGDGVEFRWSIGGASVVVRKQSSNGTGSFNFSRGGAIGAGSFALNTASANPALSATFPVSNHTQAITLAETLVPASFTLTGVACLDQRGLPVNATLAGGALSIPAANYGANQTITCTFSNTFNAELSVTKTNTPAQGAVDQAADRVVSGAPTAYTIVVRNGGPGAASGAVLRDPVPAGVTCSTATCGGASGGAVCPPAASVTVAALQSAAGLSLPTLPATGSLTFTLQCTVP